MISSEGYTFYGRAHYWVKGTSDDKFIEIKVESAEPLTHELLFKIYR